MPSTMRPKLTSIWRRSCSSSSGVGRLRVSSQSAAPAANATPAATEAICHSRTEIWVMVKAELGAGMAVVTPAVPRDTTQPENTAASPRRDSLGSRRSGHLEDDLGGMYWQMVAI